ncbi:MAG TPA: alpha/beta hydrolase [Verrucomicrobiae bacterium]|jgi:pimeloyl-ACP methyl ester carboxylesterase|nr:alpha/beta hydrolase [Verrucomicrobiae bacterium]
MNTNTSVIQLIAKKRAAVLAVMLAGSLGFAMDTYGSGHIFKKDYPASTNSDELQISSTFTIWIPEGVTTLRGVVVHQHGAGIPASEEGYAAAYDLHWQALCKKWDCALLSPSYHVLNSKVDDSPGASQLWFDPRRGSEKTFLTALSDLGKDSQHPELEKVPWVLWGHSGGGIWADVMAARHPERVAAMWLRSGSAAMWTVHTNFLAYEEPDLMFEIPIMCNSGIEEKNNRPWDGPLVTVRNHRAHNSPIAFAPDPLTGHWCGNSRYLAIPYLDACLALRLPDKGGTDQKLKSIDMSKGWLAPVLGDTAVPASEYKDDPKGANWLPNETVAKAWMEYVKTGAVSDSTPPPAPYNVKVLDKGEEGSTITWEADADFESGIHHFIIMRDGRELGNWPAVNQVRFQVRPNFQAGWMNSYGDAPGYPPREMRFEDPNAKDRRKVSYEVISVNTVGLKSEPAVPVSVERVSRSK